MAARPTAATVMTVSRVLRLPPPHVSPGSTTTLAAATWAAVLMLATATTLGVLVPATTGEFHYFQPSEHAASLDELVRPSNQHPIAATAYFQLDPLFSHIDERVCATVEHGVKERLYFLRVPFPRVDDVSPGMVRGPGHRFVPITSPVQTVLLSIVRNELRPAPIKPRPPSGAAQSRGAFEAALRHRPGDPGPSVAM